MKVEYKMPPEVVGLEYRKNHHWLKLKNDQGQEITLNATGILIGKCYACKAMCVAFANMGTMKCTHCQSDVQWMWTKPQLSFIPERQTDFMAMMAVHGDDDKKDD